MFRPAEEYRAEAKRLRALADILSARCSKTFNDLARTYEWLAEEVERLYRGPRISD